GTRSPSSRNTSVGAIRAAHRPSPDATSSCLPRASRLAHIRPTLVQCEGNFPLPARKMARFASLGETMKTKKLWMVGVLGLVAAVATSACVVEDKDDDDPKGQTGGDGGSGGDGGEGGDGGDGDDGGSGGDGG